jgi:hypothetical protein
MASWTFHHYARSYTPILRPDRRCISGPEKLGFVLETARNCRLPTRVLLVSLANQFWDTQLRSGDSYGSKWLYVRENPVRHGYVSRAEEWPFSGTLNEFIWSGD